MPGRVSEAWWFIDDTRRGFALIPDYQSLMRPVLEHSAAGEIRIGELVETMSDELGLSQDECEELLPSGKQTVIANRVHWAKSYLKQAGLVRATRRGHFTITDRGKAALAKTDQRIDNNFLKQFDEFQEFQNRKPDKTDKQASAAIDETANETPDEILRATHRKINNALALDLLDRIREAPPAFFEQLIVELLIAMGYGGSSEEAGRALGKSGDDGIDGVIDQDPLGVDQIYLQAKRYAEGNSIGSGAIRDIFGGLSLKRAQKGIFVTTSAFSPAAIETAKGLGNRIVLIDGRQLSKLMIAYTIGCRDQEILHIKKIDEDYFG
jgi:restriction system protein